MTFLYFYNALGVSSEPPTPQPVFVGPVEVAPSETQVSAPALAPRTVRDFLVAVGAPPEWIPAFEVINYCESKGNWGVVGDHGNSLGGYQLWSGWFHAGEDPLDPMTNTRVAVRVREIRGRFGGAGGWSCADLNGIY